MDLTRLEENGWDRIGVRKAVVGLRLFPFDDGI